MRSASSEPLDVAAGTESFPRVCVAGPLPPPAGGMANQCEQLVRLLEGEGVPVEVVRNNSPYRPAWIGRFPLIRALARLVPYVNALWRATGRADVVHIFANSGWAWHLFAAPALRIARLRRVPAIVNYRGGNAEVYFGSAPRQVLKLLASAHLLVTPSEFLHEIFGRYGLDAEIIPNIVDLSRFTPSERRSLDAEPHIIVTRNLEAIYDIPTAVRAFARIRAVCPNARLTVAGSGPELSAIQSLTASLKLQDSVTFPGRIDNADIARLYASADCMLNPSTVDNMPISILEAFASGVPVISTDAGGIPQMVEHGVSALLVQIGDDAAMAREALRILQDRMLADNLRRAGFAQASQCAWPAVRERWLDAYRRAAGMRNGR
jgi:glycosyltransferase involved in cell wall biosynthesis